MNITIAQQNYLVGDVSGNCTKIIDVIKNSTADIIVFPEGALSGLPLLDLNVENNIEKALEQISKIAPDKEVIVGTQDFQAAYLHNGEIRIIDNNALLLGDIYIHFEAARFIHHAPGKRLEEFIELAKNEKRIVVAINQVGASTDTVFYGGSSVCFPSGEVITLPMWKEAVKTVSLTEPRNDRSEWGDASEQVYQAILLAIRDYFRKNSAREACVAFSGGIDSAVVLALAVKALGSENVRALILPSQFTTKESLHDAIEMSERCGVRYNIIEIDSLYNEALRLLSPVFGKTEVDTTEENIQSRLRLMLTMALSNKTGALMLNTSNKSEIAVGYGTLYGDTSGALGVIADLYKSEVYQLAKYINEVDDNMIPQNIIDKEPSAELRAEQKDSDSLPIYSILDAVLYRLIEKRNTPEEIIAEGFPESDVRRAARLLHGADFKRKQLPPAIRLAETTFSVEYQMPITKSRNV